MTPPTNAPRLHQQLLRLLFGASWLSLLSLGILSGLWLANSLQTRAELGLELLATRTGQTLDLQIGRQQERVLLLTNRPDFLGAAQALPDPEAQRQLRRIFTEVLATTPGTEAVWLNGPDQQPLISTDTRLTVLIPPLPDTTDNNGGEVSSVYLATAAPHFHHQTTLFVAGNSLGQLHVLESANAFHALLNALMADDKLHRYRVYNAAATTEQIAGTASEAATELTVRKALAIPGWSLELAARQQDLMQPFYQWLAGLAMLTVALTVLALLAGGTAARRLARPLDSMAAYASQWRVGTPWQLQLPDQHSAEMRQLADSLAQMASRENTGQLALTEALLETQQVEEQFRNLFEHSPVACLLADPSGRIQLINRACASLFDYQVEQLRGENIECLVPHISRAGHHAGMNKFFAAPREHLLGVSRDIFGLRRDGVEIQLEIGVTPIRLGGVSLALATINDLSTRKAYEQALLAMSRTDGLTGIPNRRHFDQVIAEEWRRLRRSHQGMAVLMIDIDHFKQFNDRFGHLLGDEALRMVGKALKQQLHRPGDFIARYGGEEFVVLLPDTDREGALQLAEQMRAAIAALPPLEHPEFADNTVTVSVGTAALQDCNGKEPADLLSEADRQLYEAKRAGRNRVKG